MLIEIAQNLKVYLETDKTKKKITRTTTRLNNWYHHRVILDQTRGKPRILKGYRGSIGVLFTSRDRLTKFHLRSIRDFRLIYDLISLFVVRNRRWSRSGIYRAILVFRYKHYIVFTVIVVPYKFMDSQRRSGIERKAFARPENFSRVR